MNNDIVRRRNRNAGTKTGTQRENVRGLRRIATVLRRGNATQGGVTSGDRGGKDGLGGTSDLSSRGYSSTGIE